MVAGAGAHLLEVRVKASESHGSQPAPPLGTIPRGLQVPCEEGWHPLPLTKLTGGGHWKDTQITGRTAKAQRKGSPTPRPADGN